MDLELTNATVAIVRVLADVGGLVGRIHIKPQEARSALICHLRHRQRQCTRQHRHHHHRRRPLGQIQICLQVVAVHGLLLTNSMRVATAQRIVWPMLPNALRVMVIGHVLTGHAQLPLLLLFHVVVAARGHNQHKRKRVVKAHLGARPAPAIAINARVTGSIRAWCEFNLKKATSVEFTKGARQIGQVERWI